MDIMLGDWVRRHAVAHAARPPLSRLSRAQSRVVARCLALPRAASRCLALPRSASLCLSLSDASARAGVLAQAASNLKSLDSAGLRQFQEVIELENPDLFRWLTGQEAVPEAMDNAVLRTLVEDLRGTREPKVTVRSAVGFEGKVWE